MTARDRTLRAQTRRIEESAQSEQLRRAIEQPALWAGNDRYKTLGAAGGVPVRGLKSNGAIAIGEPVQAGQGIVSGLPNTATQEALVPLIEGLIIDVSNLRNYRGLQEFSGDPNDEDSPAYPLFPYQMLSRADTAQLYYWRPGDGTNPGTWVEVTSSGGGSLVSTGSVSPSAAYVVDTDTDDWPNSQANIVDTQSALIAPYFAAILNITSPNYYYFKWDFASVPDTAAVSVIEISIVNSLGAGREMAAIAAIETAPVANGVSTAGTTLDQWIMAPETTLSGSTGASLARAPGSTTYEEILDAGRGEFPVPGSSTGPGTVKTFLRRIDVAITGAALKNFVLQLRSTSSTNPNAAFISCAASVTYQ